MKQVSKSDDDSDIDKKLLLKWDDNLWSFMLIFN